LNIDLIKNSLKKDPTILFRHPLYLLQLPLVIYKLIIRRFKTDPTFVYLTESKLEDLLSSYNDSLTNNLVYSIAKEKNDFFTAIKRADLVNNWSDLYKADILSRFNRGDIVYMLLINDVVVSYLFTSEKIAVFTPVGIRLHLPKGTFAIYDVYTIEEYRGKGFYRMLFLFVVSQYKRNGFSHLWLWLMKHNQISIKTHIKLGLSSVIMILKLHYIVGIKKKTKETTQFPLTDLLV
jgi:GNAT superfamily N-acetyltransferase